MHLDTLVQFSKGGHAFEVVQKMSPGCFVCTISQHYE